MKTLIVVRLNGFGPDAGTRHIREMRERMMHDMEEGLLVIDDRVKEITVSDINQEIGLDFGYSYKNAYDDREICTCESVEEEEDEEESI